MSPTSRLNSLPIVDLNPLSSSPISGVTVLSESLSHVFSTTGFAYLKNAPLSFTSAEVIGLAKSFFNLSEVQKSSVAKASYVDTNQNTYRGYFPVQVVGDDNRKEGFDIATAAADDGGPRNRRVNEDGNENQGSIGINLHESNVWPSDFTQRPMLEKLHTELQDLSGKLLALLAMALGKPGDYFEEYMTDSLSTLRLLHYPPPPPCLPLDKPNGDERGGLCCTEHTDSGILTLLYQDRTGGLEVLARSADGVGPEEEKEKEEWISVPPIPNTIIINIGDLMAYISNGKYRATVHRVRNAGGDNGAGRYSVPFFFEPGERCVVRSVEAREAGKMEEGETKEGDIGKEEVQGVVYGDHVRGKMESWVEFQGAMAGPPGV